ncbi:MAG: CoA transferase [Chloroflexi bacterium]|nr:CoA transferase [Chloroflexota bacterium]
MLALESVKILDLTRAGPGPYCTMILGDLGAEVIKIEAPLAVGDRQAGSFHSPVGDEGKREAAYQCLHRNKRSVALNLRADAGRRIFHQLAKKADIIVEGFRPGVVQRLGIDYEAISKINPGIIYCSITGYGQDGPYSGLSGHDINYISMGGALSLVGEADRPPSIPLNLMADYGGGGANAAIGILGALIVRDKTGKGQYIDISLTDSAIYLNCAVTVNHFYHKVVPQRQSIWPNGGYPYYNVYQAKDGGYVTIGCLEPWLWEKFCRAIGKEEFIPVQFKVDHFVYPPEGNQWQEVFSSLRQVFLTRTRDEWFEFLSQKDVPVGKVYSMDEVFADPQVLHRQMVIEVEHPTEGKVKQVGLPIKLSDTPGEIRSLAPVLGEHTEEVLTELGYNKSNINELRQEGVVS